MSRDYGQYCPVTLGSEVLANRWTLMIVREMVLGSTRVFSGIESLDDARARSAVRLDGAPALTRSFGRWFLWSPFAPTVRDLLAQH